MFVSCTSTEVATENTEGSREIASMSAAQLETVRATVNTSRATVHTKMSCLLAIRG